MAVAPVTDLETLRSESANFTNHAIVDTFIGHGPHVRDGSPAQNAGRIKVPVLMFHGDLDSNVEIGKSRLMASRCAPPAVRSNWSNFTASTTSSRTMALARRC